MKRRFLPIGLFILAIGTAIFFISATDKDGAAAQQAKNEKATDYLTSLRVNQKTGQINPSDFLRAADQVQRKDQLRSGSVFEFNWTTLGPNNAGGRTRALLFDNQDPNGNVVYAGSVMGGMFKSTTRGDNWFKINLDAGNLNVSCIAQAENGDIYIGTGEGFTVDQFTVIKDWGYDGGFLGKGIFKSTDGDMFTLLESTKPSINGNNEVEWGFINELAIAPSGGRIYAATNTGLKYSDNGGNTWQYAQSAERAELNEKSGDVKIGSNGIVVAEVGNLCYVSEDGNPANFVMQSGDSTWNLPPSNVGRIEFDIAPSNPDIIYAVVLTTNGDLYNVYRSVDKGMTWNIIGPGGSNNFRVFKTAVATDPPVGLYSAVIKVFPDDPDHILLGGINMWDGYKVQEEGFFDWRERSFSDGLWLDPGFTFPGQHTYQFVPGNSGQCLIGTNGGIHKVVLNPALYTFEFRNKDYIAGQFYTVNTTEEKKNVIGGAQDLGTVYIDGTSNPADSKRGKDIWTTAADVPDGKNGGYAAISTIYPSAYIYSRYPHPAKNGNIETFIRRNEYAGGPDWSASMMDDRYASNAFLSPILLWESYNDQNSRDSINVKIFKSVPAGGFVWVESANAGRQFKYITPVALNAGDSVMVQDIITTKVFVGGDNRVMMSKEVIQFGKEPEWFVISNNTTGFSGVPSAMAYSADANHLFVGTTDGELYRISNISYAYNFERADVTSPYCVISTKRIPVYVPGTSEEISQVITSVAVDPNNPERVIITLGNYGNDHYVYLTSNALAQDPQFRSVQGDPANGGLPQMPVYSSLMEMNAQNNLVFVGSEYGIYVTENIQAVNPTWTAVNTNIGKVPVMMLKQQLIRKTNDTIYFDDAGNEFEVIKGNNNFGVIYGATYGRGLIMLDDFQKPVGIFNPSGSTAADPGFEIYPNPASHRVTVSFDLESAADTRLAIYSLGGMQVNAINLGNLVKGEHKISVSCGNLPSGTYVMLLNTGKKTAASKFIVR